MQDNNTTNQMIIEQLSNEAIHLSVLLSILWSIIINWKYKSITGMDLIFNVHRVWAKITLQANLEF